MKITQEYKDYLNSLKVGDSFKAGEITNAKYSVTFKVKKVNKTTFVADTVDGSLMDIYHFSKSTGIDTYKIYRVLL